jgi:hypothetical protein
MRITVFYQHSHSFASGLLTNPAKALWPISKIIVPA